MITFLSFIVLDKVYKNISKLRVPVRVLLPDRFRCTQSSPSDLLWCESSIRVCEIRILKRANLIFPGDYILVVKYEPSLVLTHPCDDTKLSKNDSFALAGSRTQLSCFQFFADAAEHLHPCQVHRLCFMPILRVWHRPHEHPRPSVKRMK